jgi:hypothetical protein
MLSEDDEAGYTDTQRHCVMSHGSPPDLECHVKEGDGLRTASPGDKRF